MKNNFLDIFDQQYYSKLNPIMNWEKQGVVSNLCQRGDGFRLVFQMLVNQKKDFYRIIETGVLRTPEKWTDGQSTFLFQEFVKCNNGVVEAVDISIEACESAKSYLDQEYVKVFNDDSLNFLSTISLDDVSLIHLDSYDIKWSRPQASAEHHLAEFKLIENKIKKGTILLIDDNTQKLDGPITGKGMLIVEYLMSKGIFPLYRNYQLIYQF
jgi:hypothetical protein